MSYILRINGSSRDESSYSRRLGTMIDGQLAEKTGLPLRIREPCRRALCCVQSRNRSGDLT